MALFGRKDVIEKYSELRNERFKILAELARKRRIADLYKTSPPVYPGATSEYIKKQVENIEKEANELEERAKKIDSEIIELEAKVKVEDVFPTMRESKPSLFSRIKETFQRPEKPKPEFDVEKLKPGQRKLEEYPSVPLPKPVLTPKSIERTGPLFESELQIEKARKEEQEYIRKLQERAAVAPRIPEGALTAAGGAQKPAEGLYEQSLREQIEALRAQKEYYESLKAARGGASGGGTFESPETRRLHREQIKPLLEQTELKAGLKKHGKEIGLASAFALIPLGVSYFLLNTWISAGVNLLPAPIGPLLGSLWFVPYAVIYLLFFMMLAPIKSPSTVMISGVLMGLIIGLVAWLVNGIFVPFFGPFLGPGLTCALEITKAQQQGIPIPADCLTTQNQQSNVQKTGSVNLLSVSFGQSGVPFPSPRQSQQYQFPMTIINPSEFDIGPVVIESGYMCGKVSGYLTCGGSHKLVVNGNTQNVFVPNYMMAGTSCTSSDKCKIASGGPPLVVSLQGVCTNSILLSTDLTYDPTRDCSQDIDGKTSTNTVPFPASYVSLYVYARYPFTTAGSNDYYIANTYNDVPKNAPACQGSGTRELGRACTGAGPLNVVPSFAESYLSLDSTSQKEKVVTLVIYLSNVGDGAARIDSINVTRFTPKGLTPIDVNGNPNTVNCFSPIPGDASKQNGNRFADGLSSDKKLRTYYYTQQPWNNVVDTSTSDFIIHSGDSAQVICNYKIIKSDVQSQLTGPTMDVKVESIVSYDYYETPSKTDILVNQAFPSSSSQSSSTTTQ